MYEGSPGTHVPEVHGGPASILVHLQLGGSTACWEGPRSQSQTETCALAWMGRTTPLSWGQSRDQSDSLEAPRALPGTLQA